MVSLYNDIIMHVKVCEWVSEWVCEWVSECVSMWVS